MEFLWDTEGGEYSVKRTYPPGKWLFYEQILKVPTYAIFAPETGLLEVYRLQNQRYELELPDPEGRHWLSEMGLFLGVWQGKKDVEVIGCAGGMRREICYCGVWNNWSKNASKPSKNANEPTD